MPILSRRHACSALPRSAPPSRRAAPFAQTAPGGPFTLPPLPYAPDANEPHIDAQTMQIHHDRHHAAYVANLNAAVKDYPQVAAMGLSGMLGKLGELPEAIRTAVRNNGGGHANHSMFWQVMGGKGGAPSRRACRGDRSRLRLARQAEGGVNRAGPDAVRLRLGDGERRSRRQARGGQPAQPGHAADGWRPRAVRQRRVGARLLSEIPEPSRRLPGRLVERGELAEVAKRYDAARAGTLDV